MHHQHRLAIAVHVRREDRLDGRNSPAPATTLAAVVLCFSLVWCIRLNYFRCTTDTEPYVYVQTYNDMNKLTEPLLKMARKNPLQLPARRASHPDKRLPVAMDTG